MASVGEFKGKAVLKLNEDYPQFSFGLSKAVMILENIEEIVDFLKEYGDREQRDLANQFAIKYLPVSTK